MRVRSLSREHARPLVTPRQYLHSAKSGRMAPDPDHDRRYLEDLRAILPALDALALYGDLWALLPPRQRAAWDARWRERMELLEGLPGRFTDSRPTLGETGEYQRPHAKIEELRPEIERLGLYAPQRR